MSTPSDAFFVYLQKGKRKMLIHPNYSRDYRNWAYCCVRIRTLSKMLDLYSAGKVTNMGEQFRVKIRGRKLYDRYCLEKSHRISRRLTRYLKLRDSIASVLGSPEKHLLQREDMLNMIGNVIENTPRHAGKTCYCALNECSADGSRINDFDAWDLLALGYGK